MMYQRLAMAAFRSPTDAEHYSDRRADHLICQQEEYACHGGKQKHHGGGNGGLPPTRPCDLRSLLAHFLQKLEWTDLCHCFNSRFCVLSPFRTQLAREFKSPQRRSSGCRNSYRPARAQSLADETARGPILGDTNAAEVRIRAAGIDVY